MVRSLTALLSPHLLSTLDAILFQQPEVRITSSVSSPSPSPPPSAAAAAATAATAAEFNTATTNTTGSALALSAAAAAAAGHSPSPSASSRRLLRRRPNSDEFFTGKAWSLLFCEPATDDDHDDDDDDDGDDVLQGLPRLRDDGSDGGGGKISSARPMGQEERERDQRRTPSMITAFYQREFMPDRAW